MTTLVYGFTKRLNLYIAYAYQDDKLIMCQAGKTKELAKQWTLQAVNTFGYTASNIVYAGSYTFDCEPGLSDVSGLSDWQVL